MELLLKNKVDKGRLDMRISLEALSYLQELADYTNRPKNDIVEFAIKHLYQNTVALAKGSE